MPKLIEQYDLAELISVEKISDKDYEDWKWREGYLGFQARLMIIESEMKYKGQIFISFNDFKGNYLNTGYGKYTIVDDIVTMTTKNSIYKFRIISK